MSNNIKVYMKELEGASWTDLSSSCVRTNFIIREGFGSLGSASDVSKLSIEYKADDLASATLFHTSAKAIRVSVDGYVRFEGYTEGNATVNTTNSIGLAWVKLSAFPYSKSFEDAVAPASEILNGYKVLDATDPANSLVHALMSRIQSNIPEPYKTAVDYYGYSIITNEKIESTANPVLINEGDSYLEVLDALLGEFGLARYVKNNYIYIVKPYAENKPITELGYNDILINPSFTTKPYKKEKSPKVTVGKIVSYDNDLVYRLRKEDEAPPTSEVIEVGKFYPAEGNLEADYSSDRENDNVSFLFAEGLKYEYLSKGPNGTEVSLDIPVKELDNTSALFRFQNNTADYAYLNQFKIIAQRAYYKDTSLIVEEVDSKAKDREEIESRFISSGYEASAYIASLHSESKAERFTATFESGKVSLSPASVVRIGDIPFDILIRYREDNLATGISKYSGVAYDAHPINTTSVVKRQTATSSDSLQYISLALDGFAYTYDADGNLEPANQLIKASVKRYGIADNPIWTINGNTLDTSETTINVPSSYMVGHLITVSVKVGGFESEDYIYKVTNGKVGKDGEKGEAGKGIASIEKYYAVTQTQTQPSPNAITSTSLPSLSSTDKYLWCKEVIKYSGGSDSKTVSGSVINIYNTDGVISSIEYEGNGTIYVSGKNLINSVYKGYFLTSGEEYAKESNAYRVYTAHLGVGTYTFSSSEAIYLLRIRINTVNNELLQQNKTKYSFTLTEPAKVEICVKYVSGEAIDDNKLKCLIEQGTSATEYAEPVFVADTTLPITLLQPQTTIISSDGVEMQVTYGKPSEDVSVSLIGVYGDKGQDGAPGKDATPSYTWVMYANNQSGYDMTSNSANMSYIGIAYNKPTATPSSEPTDYTWTLIKGTSAKTFNISVDSNTYIRDLRDASTVNSINLSIDKQGYSGEPSVVVSNGSYENNVITIPYNNNYDSVTITVTLESITKSIVLSVLDKTEYKKNWGTLTAYPTDGVLDGDYFSCIEENSNGLGVGMAYEKIPSGWKQMQASSLEILNCLNAMLSSNKTIPDSSFLYSWIQNLIAQKASIEKLVTNKAFIDSLKATKALFEGIEVVGSFEGGVSGNVAGDVTNTVLRTLSKNESPTTFSATEGSTSFAYENSAKADGVLAYDVKGSIEAFMKTKTDRTAYNASGAFDGWDFDQIMRVSNVSSEVALLQSTAGNGYASQTFSYTNNKPVGIKLYIRPIRKKITEKYIEKGGYWVWEESYSYEGGGNTEPSVWDTYDPNSSFSDAGEPSYEGEKYFQYTDIKGSNGNYTWTVVVWEGVWVATEEEKTATYYGSVIVDGTTYNSDSEIEITNLAKNHEVVVTLSGVSQQHGGTIVTSLSSVGSVGFYWKESENYNAGIAFLKEGSVSNYLVNMPDKILANHVSLVVDGYDVLDLPMGTARTWTYYRDGNNEPKIYKLFALDWTYSPGTYTNFDSDVCTATVIYSDGSSKSISKEDIHGFTSINTSERKGFTISGTNPIALYSNQYVRYYSLNIATYSKPIGVYAQNLLPMANSSYSLGNSDNKWKDIQADAFNGKPLANQARTRDTLAWIGGDGVMEVGCYVDFHQSNGDADYSVRLSSSSGALNCSGEFTASKVWNAVFS